MSDQFELCSICGEFSNLTCPACKKLYCVHCFAFHGEDCYEQSKKKDEQKKCSVCGRYASINPTVHCSDCQIEICRSCLYAHRKTHEVEKAKHRCANCGTATSTECDECCKPFCTPCFAKHEWVHKTTTTYRCSRCNALKQQDPHQKPPFWECPTCHDYYCDACRMTHMHIRWDAGKVNFDAHNIKIDEDLLKNLRDAFDWAKSNGAQQQAKAEEERQRQEETQRAREKAEQEDFFRRFWDTEQQYYSSFSDTYQQHYQSQQHRTRQQTYHAASGASSELTSAFSLLQLSTRATVQEVKRAFKRKAKETHPDVGGSQEAFIKLNNAYELALAHAERNER